MQQYPWNLSPHVISGAVGKMNRGRRRLIHQGADEELPWYCLLVLESGSFRLFSREGEPQDIVEPCALLLEPASSQRVEIPPLSEYSWVDWGLTAEKRILRYEQGQAWRYASRKRQPTMLEYFGFDTPLLLDAKLFSSSLKLCREVNSLWWRGGQDLLQAHLCVYAWLLEFLAIYDPTPESSSALFPEASPELRRLVDLAELQLEQRLDTRLWAEMAGISRSTLHARVTAELGMSAGALLDEIRLNRARRSLKEGHSVLQAAKDSGFQSRSSFSSWFRKQTGLPPAQWRNSS